MVEIKKLIKNNQRLMPFLLAAILILFLGVIFYFLNQESKLLVQKKLLLAQNKTDLVRLDQIEKNLKDRQAEIELVSQSLPGSYEEVAAFVSQVEAIADSRNQALEIKIDENIKTEKEGPANLGLGLKITGSYQGLKEVLSQIAKLPYHTQIIMLKTEGTEGKISTQVNIRLFMRSI